MASNSVVTEAKLQEFYNKKIYDYLNGATHTGCVPLGTILPYFGETAPTHFLICDGTEYAKADYPELAEHLLALTDPSPYVVSGDNTKFKVPDLRGEFLRGAGTNSHAYSGNGANVGKHQSATIHEFITVGQTGIYSEDKDSSRGNVDYVLSNALTYNEYSPSGTHRPGGGTWSGQNGTSRPTNTSVTYIIAYRNAYIDLALDGFPIDISNPTDGQLLMWDATAGRWINGGHKYSTDEHVVGTWIDGKPIYEKTIFCGAMPNQETKEVAHNISNLDRVISINACGKNPISGGQVSFPYVQHRTDDDIQDSVFVNASNIIFISSINRSGITEMYVTLRYTKTTDTV